MKANKVTVIITMEALSIDALPAMISRAILQVQGEVENGELSMSDGDFIKWETKREEVKF